ncbi:MULTISPECIES: GGDEF domain-containing protein [Pseudovibrio]|uniref:GGDEF domain-containing protein n=1 Tax=Stappiaceae TaxID=2821832 RepID=UPI00236659F4|nr:MULTISPECIES: GGDEF domain-containing protein [Pseudovibrio]MDD7908858.1 GGDEF domain-containing protein [Pseudovibrio exalbescens]MDX5593824.1 GGDEF domain-containing protein [Pseudovibrio sp. SPO723]
MSNGDDFLRTIAYGETALDFIKTNSLPAYPRNYELWYSYASGFNQSLNRAINKIIEKNGKITADETQKIYNRFLSPNRLGERIDDVGEQISIEVKNLLASIDSGKVATDEYGGRLRTALESLQEVNTREELEQVIRGLINATTATAETNGDLKNQLISARKQISTLRDSLEAIRYESLTDELTTLNNRKHFDQSLEKELQEAANTGRPVALLLTDIDHFKQFNDNYGHQTGDQVLRLVALSVKQNINSHDIACRYGGEEFGIIMPHCTLEKAKEVAERIRRTVTSKELVKRSTGENLGRITISIGVAISHPDDTLHSIVSRADDALYTAKNAGRNLVRSEKDIDRGPAKNHVA